MERECLLGGLGSIELNMSEALRPALFVKGNADFLNRSTPLEEGSQRALLSFETHVPHEHCSALGISTPKSLASAATTLEARRTRLLAR